MRSFDAGVSYDTCIVVNRTSDKKIALGSQFNSLKVLYRHNVGMNIGAWNHGWRSCIGYENVLFLQDDCYIAKDGWLQTINEKLSCAEIGLIGEAANTGWDIPWSELRVREANLGLPEHTLDGKSANRVDVYLDFLSRNEILSGDTGYHMRSLVWASKTTTLKKIGGFPQGRNYGECVAAEIAVTKQIQELGLKVENVSGSDFSYIRHLEWNQDYPGGPFSKNPVVAHQLDKLRKENARLTEQLESRRKPVSKFVKRLVRQTES
ncbi:MAG: hypothetical protein AAF542_14080 [Pseudomonadota bacterium]